MSAPDATRALVAKTRAAQGLPPHVVDPFVCQRVADLLRPVEAEPKPKRRTRT